MVFRHRLTVVSLGLALWMGVVAAQPVRTLPEKLSDAEYWALIERLSEAGGSFQSDNLVSNELYMQTIIPELVTVTKPGRVYLGVGPEQNFTYIAALKPRMVFIIDVRRGNLHTHMFYKALFELSKDRAAFVSMLFSKKRPDGLTTKSTAQEIFSAFADVVVSLWKAGGIDGLVLDEAGEPQVGHSSECRAPSRRRQPRHRPNDAHR